LLRTAGPLAGGGRRRGFDGGIVRVIVEVVHIGDGWARRTRAFLTRNEKREREREERQTTEANSSVHFSPEA
jgi:hypothetical protein